MSEPRTRLDEAMTARSLEIKKRWKKLADEAGISTSALGGMRRGQYKPSAHTARALENALLWASGSIEAVLAGGDPTPLEEAQPIGTTDQADSIAAGQAERERLIALIETDEWLEGTLARLARLPRRPREAAKRAITATLEVAEGSEEAG